MFSSCLSLFLRDVYEGIRSLNSFLLLSPTVLSLLLACFLLMTTLDGECFGSGN